MSGSSLIVILLAINIILCASVIAGFIYFIKRLDLIIIFFSAMFSNLEKEVERDKEKVYEAIKEALTE